MAAIELLEQLGACGVHVTVDRNELVLRPAKNVPSDLLVQIKEHKTEIIQELQPIHGDGQPPLLDRPPETEQELRRLIDHLADKAAFYSWTAPIMERTDTDESGALARLLAGHLWLFDQHQKWQTDDASAVNDEEFSRVWRGWWELDQQLRADGFQGCIYGPDGTCPKGFPCQGCSDVPTPGVAAQLALGSGGLKVEKPVIPVPSASVRA